MKFDRSKLQKTELSVIEKTRKSAEKTMYKDGEYTQFYTIEDGNNVLRVLPAVKGNLPYVPLKTSKLDVEVNTYDKEGNVTGKEVKSKNIFCADIHGTEVLKGKDPICTYIGYVKELAEEIQDKDERNSFLFPITGGQTKKGWVWGIDPILGYVCFIKDSNGEIRKLQLRSAWMKEMNNISVQSSEDETLCLDIFSDPDTGQPLIINKHKDDKGKKNVFDISALMPKKTQQWTDFFDEHMVSDEVLEKLSQMKSLEENYVEIYSAKDFKMACDGLKRFDEAHPEYDIFANPEFIDELEEMAAMLPEDEEPKEEVAPAKNSRSAAVSSKKAAVEEKPSPRPIVDRSNRLSKDEEKEEKPKDAAPVKPKAAAKAAETSSYPTLIKMKSFLKVYIEEQYEGTEELPEGLSLDEVRTWYDLAQAGKELPFPIDEESEMPEDVNEAAEETEDKNDPEPEEKEAENPIEEKGSSVPSETRARLAALAERRRRK